MDHLKVTQPTDNYQWKATDNVNPSAGIWGKMKQGSFLFGVFFYLDFLLQKLWQLIQIDPVLSWEEMKLPLGSHTTVTN